MNKSKILSALALVAILVAVVAIVVSRVGAAEKPVTEKHNHEEHDPEEDDDHDHDHNQDHDQNHDHDHDQAEEHDHQEGDHDEAGGAVGPEKGITEKGALGFKLSPEALQNFGVKTAKHAGGLPQGGLVKIKDGKFAYRLRDGWIKRLALGELRAGDDVIVEGVGFVRTAEIAAEEGVAHGHSH